MQPNQNARIMVIAGAHPSGARRRDPELAPPRLSHGTAKETHRTLPRPRLDIGRARRSLEGRKSFCGTIDSIWRQRGCIAPLLLLLLGLAGCAARREGWHEPVEANASRAGSTELSLQMAEEHFERRHEEAHLRKALEQYKVVLALKPDHYPALVRLARGNFFLAHAFIVETQERVELWSEGATFAERALATNAAFRQKVVDEGLSLERALSNLDREEVDALYWLAVNLGNWVAEQPALTRLQYLSRIKALIGRLEELAPDYHQGAVSRYWGGFYAQAPALAGGNLKQSREAFERALEQAGDFFENRVLFAEVYAVKAKDRELFREQLEYVLRAPVDALVGLEPEQRIEQARARELLQRIDDLIPE